MSDVRGDTGRSERDAEREREREIGLEVQRKEKLKYRKKREREISKETMWYRWAPSQCRRCA
jgi:hypothetical protein